MIDLEAIKKHRALWEPDDCTSLPTICEHVDALVAEVERLRERCLEQEAEACGRMGHRDGLSRDRGPFDSGGQLDVAWRRGWDERSASVAEVERLRELLLNAGWPREADGIAELAQQAERAAAVAWLHRMERNARHWGGKDDARADIYARLADVFECGEHRKEEES